MQEAIHDKSIHRNQQANMKFKNRFRDFNVTTTKPATSQKTRAGTATVELPKLSKLFYRNVLLYLTVTLGGGGVLKPKLKQKYQKRHQPYLHSDNRHPARLSGQNDDS